MEILYEDRSALAIDKPSGWMVAPEDWGGRRRNLQRVLMAAIAERAFWVRSRRISYLRFVHRLDVETSGVLLLARSVGALRAYSSLFRSRSMEKVYLAVVSGTPERERWDCDLPLSSELDDEGRVRVCKQGDPSQTSFRVVGRSGSFSLIEARPITGRTHQIRVHLTESGFPIVGDRLYGNASRGPNGMPSGLALRAVALGYRDPFLRRPIWIEAPTEDFLARCGFGGFSVDLGVGRE